MAETVSALHVQRITCGHQQPVAVSRKGDEAVGFGQLAGQQVTKRFRHNLCGEIHRLQTPLSGQPLDLRPLPHCPG